MAGRFRGAVGKLSKPKTSRAARKSRSKRTVALVKRAPKLSAEKLQKRIAELTGNTTTGATAGDCSATDGNEHREPTQSTKNRERPQRQVSAMRTANKQVIPMGTKQERGSEVPAEASASAAAGVGLRLLHRAVRSQCHNRLLPHQSRHDYEYRLRTVATTGVVRLFNSLALARKAAGAVEAQEKHLTADKTLEKKQVATKEAFLAALRQSRAMDRY